MAKIGCFFFQKQWLGNSKMSPLFHHKYVRLHLLTFTELWWIPGDWRSEPAHSPTERGIQSDTQMPHNINTKEQGLAIQLNTRAKLRMDGGNGIMQTQPHREERCWTKAKKWFEKGRHSAFSCWEGKAFSLRVGRDGKCRGRERRKPSAWVANGNKGLTCPKLRIWLGAGKDHESRKTWLLVQARVRGFNVIIRRWS